MSQDIENICRVCMKICESKLVSVFFEIEDETLASMILNCANVEISESDRLPQNCCHSCVEGICNASQLIKQCKSSDKKLKERLCFEEPVGEGRDEIRLTSKVEELTEDDFDLSAKLGEQLHVTENDDDSRLLSDCSESYEEAMPENDMKRRCCGCKKDFNSLEQLVEHSKLVHLPERSVDDGAKPYECDQCFKRYSLIKSFKQHKTRLYLEKRYQCTLCGKTFVSQMVLSDHERSHNGERIYNCQVCSKKFMSKGNLATHSKLHSLSADHEKCPNCGKGFRTKKLLKSHSVVHTAERPFSCKLCPYTFVRKHYLKRHMRVHTGEKPYHCEFCDNKYAHYSDWKRHLMTHTGIKPFKCSYCDKTFPKRGNQIVHERTHTGERPFECEVCHKKFSQASYMKKHRLSHANANANQNK